MFLLDTNVLSAMMAVSPAPEVARWMSARAVEELFTSAVTQAEIMEGLAILPDGRRRQAFEQAARAMFEEDFADRVLPFDGAAAGVYADLHAVRRRAGRPVAMADLMIAAIARSTGKSIVTRNVEDFAMCGVPIINPWAG